MCPLVHCGFSEQMVSIVSMNKEHLWTRDKEISYSAIPSTSCRGQMVFRDGQVKVVRNMPQIHVFPHVSGLAAWGTSQRWYTAIFHQEQLGGAMEGKGTKGRGKEGRGKVWPSLQY